MAQTVSIYIRENELAASLPIVTVVTSIAMARTLNNNAPGHAPAASIPLAAIVTSIAMSVCVFIMLAVYLPSSHETLAVRSWSS